MMSIPGITNSGTMPIDAGGGSAGPSSANASNESGFRVGNINMNSNPLSGWLLAVLTVATLWFLMKKAG